MKIKRDTKRSKIKIPFLSWFVSSSNAYLSKFIRLFANIAYVLKLTMIKIANFTRLKR